MQRSLLEVARVEARRFEVEALTRMPLEPVRRRLPIADL
jgi:hypothetical protein